MGEFAWGKERCKPYNYNLKNNKKLKYYLSKA